MKRGKIVNTAILVLLTISMVMTYVMFSYGGETYTSNRANAIAAFVM